MIAFRRILSIRAKGGILSFVLGISLVVILITGSLILAAYYFRALNSKIDVEQHLRDNVLSGIQLLLDNPSIDDTSLDLFGNGTDSVGITTGYWGIYPIVTVTARQGKHAERTAVMLGASVSPYGRSSVYLADENVPLQVVGTTYIVGDAYLPAAGIKSAIINNKSYTSAKLMEGAQNRSERTLPELDAEIIATILPYFSSQMAVDETQLPDSLTQSFYSDAPWVYDGAGEVVIDGTFKGRVLITSQRKVVITEQARLDNVIVCAPEIVIADRFKGRLQAFARDTLVVGATAELLFPSVLGVLGSSNSYLYVGEASVVEGVVFNGSTNASAPAGVIKTGFKSSIYGQVYCKGLLELNGAVSGNVTCRKFTTESLTGYFENYLVDASIDNRFINTDSYAGSLLWFADKNRRILQWLK
jgi:cytoskeletal protein CcmA (bactofilin family)